MSDHNVADTAEIYLTYLNHPDVQALALTDAEIIGAVEQALHAQGLQQTTIEPRMHLVPEKDYPGHFNVLRGILEKTATFFGNNDFGACIHGIEDEELYARALNLMSHETYSLYQPVELVEDNKQLFKQILDAFLERYKFVLPGIFPLPAAKNSVAPAPAPAP